MRTGEEHEVELNAKKVTISSHGSLREVIIEGVHYDRIEQAAYNMYDPYDEYYDISRDIKNNMLSYTLIPIIDEDKNEMRYTISKYSKGIKKYFDPHKVVKAVYAIYYILFYVKDKKDVLRKYYFYISSINIRDLMPPICKQVAQKNGLNSDLYLASFIH